MKKVVFSALVLAIVATSCAPRHEKPSVFVPCVTVRENPTDKMDCMCRFQDRIHVQDTAYYSERMYQIARKKGRAFWQPFMYGI